MLRWVLGVFVFLFYLLHQDTWFWHTARPVVFGVLPIGLFYHLCYSLAAAVLMWLLVRYAWPTHLEEEVDRIERTRGGR